MGGPKLCFDGMNLNPMRLACQNVLCIVTSCSFVVSLIVLLVQYGPRAHPEQSALRPASDDISVLNQSAKGLNVFLHVSDIHLSKFVPKRTEQFQTFCSQVVPLVSPLRVIVTGDITDGRMASSTGKEGQQHLSEWEDYRHTLEANNLFNRSMVLDVRGNHDAYGADGPADILYDRYGVWGGTRVYGQSVYGSDGTVFRFATADASLEPGLSGPLNYLGYLSPSRLQQWKDIATADAAADIIILFGHYPVAFINSPTNPLEGTNALLYLSGHLHDRHMWQWFHDGGGKAQEDRSYLELEVEDLKDHMGFRLLVFDHGLVSFRDMRLDQYPIILPTSPKDARFSNGREPLQLMRDSSHVRVLVFSPHPVQSVTMSIRRQGNEDGVSLSTLTLNQTEGSALWTVPWTASQFSSGMYTASLVAVDAAGNRARHVYSFSLDGSHASVGRSTIQFVQTLRLSVGVNALCSLALLYWVLWCLVCPKGYVLYLQHRKSDVYESEIRSLQLHRQLLTARQVKSGEVTWYAESSDNAHVKEKLQWTRCYDALCHSLYQRLWWYGHMSSRHWWFLVVSALWLCCGPIMIASVVNRHHWGIWVSWGSYSFDSGGPARDGSIPFFMLLWTILYALPATQLLAYVDAMSWGGVQWAYGVQHSTLRTLRTWPFLATCSVFAASWIIGAVMMSRYYGFGSVLASPSTFWFHSATTLLAVTSTRAYASERRAQDATQNSDINNSGSGSGSELEFAEAGTRGH